MKKGLVNFGCKFSTNKKRENFDGVVFCTKKPVNQRVHEKFNLILRALVRARFTDYCLRKRQKEDNGTDPMQF